MTHKKVPHYPHEIDPNKYRKGMLPANYKPRSHGPELKKDTQKKRK